MTSWRRGPAPDRGASTISSASSRVCSTGPSTSSCSWSRRLQRPPAPRQRGRGSRSCSTPSRHAGCLTRPATLAGQRSRAAARARPIGRSSRSATGSGCAPARRAGCGWATSTRDRDLLVVRGGKFGKSRLVPHGPRIAALLGEQLERRRNERRGRTPRRRCSRFDGQRPRPSAAPPARRSTSWSPRLICRSPTASRRRRLHCLRHSFAVGCLLRWYREGLDPAGAAATSSPRSWATSTPSSTAVYLTITPLCWTRPTAGSRPSPSRPGRRRERMTATPAPLGPVLHSFFLDHLITVKGLRPASVRSYRDTIRLLLVLPGGRQALKITRLDARRPHLRADRRLPAPPRARPRQPRPHPQPAARRPAHPVRIHRRPAHRRCSTVCQQVAAIPMQTGGPRRDPLPRTRRGRGAPAPPAQHAGGSRCATAP